MTPPGNASGAVDSKRQQMALLAVSLSLCAVSIVISIALFSEASDGTAPIWIVDPSIWLSQAKGLPSSLVTITSGLVALALYAAKDSKYGGTLIVSSILLLLSSVLSGFCLFQIDIFKIRISQDLGTSDADVVSLFRSIVSQALSTSLMLLAALMGIREKGKEK